MPLPQHILNRLNERTQAGLPVGFYPWEESDSMLWGFFVRASAKNITFKEIDPQGQDEGEETYTLGQIWKFDFDPIYARRLVKLGERSWSETKGRLISTARERDEYLAECLRNQFSVRMKEEGESGRITARLLSLEGHWLTYVRLDDLGREDGFIDSVRLSRLQVYREGQPSPDTWLLQNRD